MNDETLLTTTDLARRWRTTEQAVYAARHRGDCPRAVRRGRRLLWRLRDIEAWEEVRAASDAVRNGVKDARIPTLAPRSRASRS
jgi:predicted DNA-binding transcriptional regulator AlpA